MDTTLLTAGLACIIAAVVGGGLKAFGVEIPHLQSGVRQGVLGGLGLLLVAFAVGINEGWIKENNVSGGNSGPTGPPGANMAVPSNTTDKGGVASVTTAPSKAPASPAGFRITEALLRAEPSDYKGDCPITIRFMGRISAVGGSGTVSYKFLRSDGALAPVQILKFDEPGSRQVSTEWHIGGAGMNFSGWEAIKIFDPSDSESNQTRFKIECTAALPASVVSVKILKASCSKIASGALRVELSGEAVAPEGSFLVATATPYRPTPRNETNASCGTWGDRKPGSCQRLGNQPPQTEWTITQMLYDQTTVEPYMASAHVYKGEPGGSASSDLTSDVYRNLVCR